MELLNRDVLQDLNVSVNVAQKAQQVTRTLPLLALNGWVASGKDHLAPLVYKNLGVQAKHLYFALPLKREVTQLVELVSTSESPEEAHQKVSNVFATTNVTPTEVGTVVGALWLPTREGKTFTGWDKTRETRFLLQYWGTHVRRSKDPNYWVRIVLKEALESIADGVPVYITDVRFRNELDYSRLVGFNVVRVDVTRETQRERLMKRDGLEPNTATLYHEAEISLDNYTGFDLRVDNNGPAEHAVKTISDFLR